MAVVKVRVHPQKGLEPKDIAERIKAKFPNHVIEIAEFRDQVSVIIKKEGVPAICSYLHDDVELYFDHLKDLCGVDYLNKKEVRFEVVYNLYSTLHRHMIRIRAEVPENDPTIHSVTSIWAGANWHERECFDMYGIIFKGHPDLRRILLPEDWEGYPLRKDYPLKGPELEQDWPDFRKVLERSKALKGFEWEG